MLASFSGNAVMTKAKAMYGRRLTPQQYKDLSQKKTVAEIISYLRDETAYNHVLQGVQPGLIPTKSLEETLRRERFDRYMRLVHYSFGKENAYYRYMVDMAETEQILVLIRLLGIGKAEQFITSYPAFLDKFTDVSLLKLAKVRSFDELLTQLQGTRYANALTPCRPSDGAPPDYAKCEGALYSLFYNRLHGIINKAFRGRKREQLLDIFTVFIEMTNLSSLYRIKRYYPQTTEQEIRAHLIEFWRKPKGGVVEDMIAAKDIEEFAKIAAQAGYGEELFLASEAAREHIYKRYLRFASDAPVAFTAYMVLCEIEINNIISIVEAVEYAVPSNEIYNMVMGIPTQDTANNKKGGVR